MENEEKSLAKRAYDQLELHFGEKETAPNQGPVVDWAISPWTKEKAGPWAKWCAGAVCTAYLEAGSEQMKEIGTLSVQKLYDQLKERGQNFYDACMVKKGDLIFLGTENNLHHIGLVYTMDVNFLLKQNVLWTLEGNHNNQVGYNVRFEWFSFAKILR